MNGGIAMELYRTAAVLGSGSAITNMARLHDLAITDGANKKEAEQLYEVATRMGNAYAPYHLAAMIEAKPRRTKTQKQRIEDLRDLAAERGFCGSHP